MWPIRGPSITEQSASLIVAEMFTCMAMPNVDSDLRPSPS
jgi:hypothetical protein